MAALGADQTLVLPLLFALDLPFEDSAWAAIPPPERVRRMQNAIVGMLILEARKAPLVIVIEDLHWVDDESRAVIERLIDGISKQPILLVLSYRPEFQVPWTRKANFTQSRLRAFEWHLIPRESGGDDPRRQTFSPDACSIDCHAHRRRSSIRGGDRFNALAQRGSLTGRVGDYSATGEITDLQAPSTVQSIIAARIDRLDENHRQLLQTASFLGQDISPSILASVAQISDAIATEQTGQLQRSRGFFA